MTSQYAKYKNRVKGLSMSLLVLCITRLAYRNIDVHNLVWTSSVDQSCISLTGASKGETLVVIWRLEGQKQSSPSFKPILFGSFNMLHCCYYAEPENLTTDREGMTIMKRTS